MYTRTTVDSRVKPIAMLASAVLLNALSGCFDLDAHNRREREAQARDGVGGLGRHVFRPMRGSVPAIE